MEIVKHKSNVKNLIEALTDTLSKSPKVDMEKYKTDFKKMHQLKVKVGR